MLLDKDSKEKTINFCLFMLTWRSVIVAKGGSGMNILRITISAVFIFMMSYGVSSAQELLVTADDVCNQGTGSSGARLYRVDPDTAAFQEIGPIGFNGVGALAQIGDGRLVAGARADANGDKISILIEINPGTGQGSLIGTIGNQSLGGCGRVNDLTYDPATDTLFGLAIQCGGVPANNFDPNLISINPDTGAGTVIGPTGFVDVAGNSLAISSGGTLFGSGCCNPIENFYTINPQTGQGTLLSQVPPEDSLFNSFVFSPFTGELLGTANFFPVTELRVVDPFTGLQTVIGQLPDCADGLEFFEFQPRPIPTLSEWGLIAMAGVLGIIGLLAIRRRKLTA
jgi:IPTL-CTERM motif